VRNDGRFLDFSHAYVEVEVFPDEVHAPIDEFEPDSEPGMTLAQYRENRRDMQPSEPQARADP